MIIRETYLKKIRKFIDEEEIKVITGLRRSLFFKANNK